jgi:hypothetical protein
MKRSASIALIILVVLLAVSWQGGLAGADRSAEPLAPQAGAPSVVSYQGQVTVAGIAPTGTGYFKFAVVDQPACTTGYWMNDGSPVACTAPTDAVSLAVSNGLFNVLLGDTSVTNMTALPESVFSGTTRYLRVWFSSTGSAGPFVHLTPDRRIAAVPYALQATNADYLDGQDSSTFAMATHNHDDAYVNVAGDNMSGTLAVDTLSGDGISSRTTSAASTAAAVEATNDGGGFGLKAVSVNSDGIYAESAYATAIYALGDRSDAVWGRTSATTNGHAGVVGEAFSPTAVGYGIRGVCNSSNTSCYAGYFEGGVYVAGTLNINIPAAGSHGVSAVIHSTASGAAAVEAKNLGTGKGLYAYSVNSNAIEAEGANRGIQAKGTNYAGYFIGDVYVSGNLTAGGTKPFRIDHPLDPANKYLYHFAVESPEVRNLYQGNAVLDAAGEAVVALPDYFDALNAEEFNYQLTCIGGFAPVYIAEKVSGNQFKIAGGVSGLEVSWQVTAIRNDPYLRDHPVQAEVSKDADAKGTYQYPEGYGQPETAGVDYEPAQASEPGAAHP